jgi:hypothetical protein
MSILPAHFAEAFAMQAAITSSALAPPKAQASSILGMQLLSHVLDESEIDGLVGCE